MKYNACICSFNMYKVPDEVPLKKLLNPLTFCMQCIRMESANHFHIWLRRLDELRRCPTSSPAYEGSMRDHSGSTGLAFSQSV